MNPHTELPLSRPLVAILFLATLWLSYTVGAGDARADKTDVLYLDNGDRITCEVMSLKRGKLTVKTDAASTITLKWERIVRLESRYWFLVKTSSGQLHYGQIPASGQDELLLVSFQGRAVSLQMANVVEITKIKYDFWNKFDLSFSLGLNYTKATELFQMNIDARAAYRGRIHSGDTRWDSAVTDQEEGKTNRRHDFSLNYRRLMNGRLSVTANGGWQRNDELGLAARILGGMGLSVNLIQQTSYELIVSGGANINKEWASVDNQTENNVEARFSLAFAVFQFETPKTDITIAGSYLPSLTTRERRRVEIDATIRREIFKDFFVELRYYESYDSQPPPGALAKSDRGLVFGIGWTK